METKNPIFNFSAGPCILPQEVYARAAAELTNWNGTGISVMEMSHRGKDFISIAKQAENDLRLLMEIPSNFKIFFLQGGASNQYSAMCYNLLGDEPKEKQTANYVTSGFWSNGCIKEAAKYCTPTESASNLENGCTTIAEPFDWKIDPKGKYFHFCDNETIQGFEFNDFDFSVIPEGMTVVCDMSSNFCSRKVDWSKYGMVYAGAQKNVGPAGVTIVVVREDLIGKQRKDTPILCDWELFAKAPTQFYNTPCCWSIYMCGLNIAYMLEQGGIPAMKEKADVRAKILYEQIDNSDGYYQNNTEARFRSRMNVPFRIGYQNKDLEGKFVKEAAAAGLIQLGGHSSVGGARASLYNAMPIEGVEALTDFMRAFQKANPVENPNAKL